MQQNKYELFRIQVTNENFGNWAAPNFDEFQFD